MSLRIVIMAGGTGGHVFPALAVAQYLKSQQWDISWIGTEKGMEGRVVAAQGIEIDFISVAGIRGKGVSAKISNLLLLVKSCWQAFKILRRRKPNVVLGMGGYVAGPGGLIASFLKIPLVIHEQNRVPGTTNRLLVERASRVLEAFPASFSPAANAIFTGNPLRQHFLNFSEKEYWLEGSERELRILIVGGSQGAKVLNDVLPVVANKLENVEIKHQTGVASFELVKEKYAELDIKAEAIEFIQNIAAAYQWADMVICRSGAMTVSEIAAVGIPAVFVPLPHAIDDHQTANARYLGDVGASIVLAQNDLNEESLLEAIQQVQQSLEQMSKAAKSKAKLDATERVAKICIEEAAK